MSRKLVYVTRDGYGTTDPSRADMNCPRPVGELRDIEEAPGICVTMPGMLEPVAIRGAEPPLEERRHPVDHVGDLVPGELGEDG